MMMNSTDEKIKNLLDESKGLLKNSFRKYATVQDMVSRLTQNKALQTVMILFLMAKNEQERIQINNDFWLSAEGLSSEEQATIRQEFTSSFKNMLPLANSLQQQVEDYVENRNQKQAA
jgi:hypothetical protein